MANLPRFMGTLLLLASPTVDLGAQELKVQPGTRIRLSAPAVWSTPLVGNLDSLRPNTLFLHGVSVPIPTSAIERLEISQGTKSNVGRGALVGSLGGGILGVVIAVVGCKGWSANCTDGSSTGDFARGLGLIGVGGGALLGALVGSGIRSERWVEVPVQQLEFSLRFTTGGRAALYLSIPL